jgi:hypothetical protein
VQDVVDHLLDDVSSTTPRFADNFMQAFASNFDRDVEDAWADGTDMPYDAKDTMLLGTSNFVLDGSLVAPCCLLADSNGIAPRYWLADIADLLMIIAWTGAIYVDVLFPEVYIERHASSHTQLLRTHNLAAALSLHPLSHTTLPHATTTTITRYVTQMLQAFAPPF